MSRSYLKGFGALTTAAVAALTLLVTTSANAQVTVKIYDNYSDTGSDITFTGSPVTTFSSPDIAFGDNFFPVAGLTTFGAELTGCITVPETGDYTFGLNSDDGSYMFLNNSLFISNGGAHSPGTAFNTASFTAGVSVPFRISYFEDFGAPAALNLLLDGSPVPASYFVCNTVPEPGAWAFGAMAGASVLGLIARRRKG